MPSQETTLLKDKTERLSSVSGLLVLNTLGCYYDIYLWFFIFIYTVLIKWLVAYKCGYRSGIK